MIAKNEFYIAVRRANDDRTLDDGTEVKKGDEWFSVSTLSNYKDECAAYAHRNSNRLSSEVYSHDEAFPVVRIAKVRIEEIEE